MNKKLCFNDNEINSITKISLNNKDYLFISKENKNELFLIKDNYIDLKEEKFFSDELEKDIIQQLLILDNGNIIAKVDSNKISYYEKKENNLKYKKFFNNINKYGKVLGICKLSNNRFCFVSSSSMREDSNTMMVFDLFNEDLTNVQKKIEMLPPIDNIRNNLIFKSNNDKIIIIYRTGFISFNINTSKIDTIFNTGLICSFLQFHNKLDKINEDFYKYFALIIYEKDNFFLKIIKLDDCIEETEKINLAEYSNEFEAVIDDNQILDFYKENEKGKSKKREMINFYYDYNFLQNENKKKELFFDMNYDIKNDNNIILIINFIRLYSKKKLTIILEIDLNTIQFI